ncbi:HlyD family type I secretion periplasmic adaptor subunit [Sapientia aquatica]|nr:HlyD family type I secretion periplasmic adaptor subunit [Sapientia aquatica]
MKLFFTAKSKSKSAPTSKPKSKSNSKSKSKSKSNSEGPIADFLADADEIELRPIPPYLQRTLHIMLFAVVCFFTWATFSKLDINVTTTGRLITLQPNIVVQPLDTAIIKKINVGVGQIVKKGDQLAMLDPTFTEADENQLRNRLQSYETEIARLEAEMEGKGEGDKAGADSDSKLQNRLSRESQANYQAQMQRSSENISRLMASMETNRHDQEGLAARVKVLKDSEKMISDLVDQKYAVRARLLDAQDRLLEAQRSLEMSKNRQYELQRELAAAQADRRSYDTGWRQKVMEEMLNVQRDRDAIKDQLQKADLHNKLVILTAPADGVVLEIAKLSQGSIVRGTETLITLVPLDSELEAEVQIDAADIGYVKLGDVARIKLDAYPFQKHGTLEGTLRTISEDSFKQDVTSQKKMDGYYLSRIHLNTVRLKGMQKGARLLPGMTVTAELNVGKRSVMSYILWPLTKALNESIREP